MYGFQTPGPQAKAVVLPVQDPLSMARLFEEGQELWIKDGEPDIQHHQGVETADGYSKVDRLGGQAHCLIYESRKTKANRLQ
jgi:hypothetical protein